MIRLPIIIGPTVVRQGLLIATLDKICRGPFSVKRIKEKAFCATTKEALLQPFSEKYKPSLENDLTDGYTHTPVCVLLESKETFVSACATLSLLESVRVPGARPSDFDPQLKKGDLYLFIPVTESHADVMRKLFF